VSSVNELSFLPISRPRPVPSATQLSSIHGIPAVGSHVHAAWEPAGGVGRASSRAIFMSRATTWPPRETGKTGATAVAVVNEDSSSQVRSMGRGIFVVTGQPASGLAAATLNQTRHQDQKRETH
jgi:hypothetical protein